ARFGTGKGDPAARAACRAAAHLLPKLSAERVAQELVRLLETPDPILALRMMQQDGVLAVILPEARGLDRLRHMIPIEPERDPLRRLAALIETDAAGTEALAERLRFSNAWRDRLKGLASPWPVEPQGAAHAQRRALYRLGAERYRGVVLFQAAGGAMGRHPPRGGPLPPPGRGAPPPPPPPLGATPPRPSPPGARVGRLLDAVRNCWEAGDFPADRTQCLARLRELVTSTG